jgi:uncharacterized protein (TIGR00369 family)
MRPVPERSRTITWHEPLDTFAHLKAMPGIDGLRAVLAGDVPPPPIAQTLGFELVEVEPGRATFEVEPAEFHYNPIGVVHGGLALTLLDSAMGCALHSLLEAGVAYATLETKVNFVRPLTLGTGTVRCTGTIVHPGRTVATAEGRIVDADDKLYAHGTSTLLIVGS